MNAELFVCGTRGSFPVFGKDFEIYGQATTCYLIRDDEYAIVLDCGSGLANALELTRSCSWVDIIVSHIHYDHIMGLLPAEEFFPESRVRIFGNFEAWSSVSSRAKEERHVFWPVQFESCPGVSVGDGVSCTLKKNWNISFRQAVHANGALMCRIERDGLSISYTGDNEYDENQGLEVWAKDSDLLIFDGSYTPEEYPTHKGWGHSSWQKGCEIASVCNIGTLMITHFAPTCTDSILLESEKQAQKLFPGTVFAKEKQRLELTKENLRRASG